MELKYKKPPKRKVRTVILAVLGVILIGVLIWRFFIYDPPTKPLPERQQKTSDALTLISQGKNEEAKKVYDEIINSAEPGEDKYYAYREKAFACANFGDKSCATGAMKQSEKHSPNQYTYHIDYGYVLKTVKLSKDAKKQYELAIDILKSKKSLSDSESRFLKNAQSELKVLQ